MFRDPFEHVCYFECSYEHPTSLSEANFNEHRSTCCLYGLPLPALTIASNVQITMVRDTRDDEEAGKLRRTLQEAHLAL